MGSQNAIEDLLSQITFPIVLHWNSSHLALNAGLLLPLSLLLLFKKSLAGLRHQQEDEEAAEQEAAAHDAKVHGDGDHHQGGDQGDSVEDVDQHGQHLPVEVRGDDGSKGGEDDHDGNADGQVAPGILLHSCHGHHLPPVEADAGVDGHEDDGGGRGNLLAHTEEQGENGEGADVNTAA